LSTSRFCRVCKNFHDLDEPWPQACHAHFGSRAGASIQIIADIQPYRAVAEDCATGKAPIIMNRREHKEFLRRNQYVEVGNEYNKGPRAERHHTAAAFDSPREDIRRAVRKVLGRKG
jgi:hypothetical protein